MKRVEISHLSRPLRCTARLLALALSEVSNSPTLSKIVKSMHEMTYHTPISMMVVNVEGVVSDKEVKETRMLVRGVDSCGE